MFEQKDNFHVDMGGKIYREKTIGRTARRDFNYLIKKGVIRRVGPAKIGYYVLNISTKNDTANDTVNDTAKGGRNG